MTSPLLTVTPIYTALLALSLIPLAIKVIKLRWKLRVSLMDGGHDELKRAIRAHGNFTEYVPITLLLLAFSEINQAPMITLHILGSILILARFLHAYGLHTSHILCRKSAMYLTFTSLFTGSSLLIATLFIA